MFFALRPSAPVSLSARLIAVAALWVVIGFACVTLILVSLFQNAAQSAFDDRLKVHMGALISAISRSDDLAALPGQNYGEPRFAIPLSGWYWSIREAKAHGRILVESPSLFGDRLRLPVAPQTTTLTAQEQISSPVWGELIGPAGARLRTLSQTISFEGKAPLRLAIAGSKAQLSASTSAFAKQAILTMLALGLVLITAIFLQVRVGLRPLSALQRSLTAVRYGEDTRINTDLPRELKPLAQELNALIQSNGQVVETARRHVGNLAHALKTPLSVIINETGTADTPLARKVAEQSRLMHEQINHYLEKARMAAQRRVIGVSTPVTPQAKRMLSTMEKIYQDKQINFSRRLDDNLFFRGESQDLDEILGNLLDNAAKYCDKKVALTIKSLGSSASDTAKFAIIVEDDGPGLDESACHAALNRGTRLDETLPGAGLGLSILIDLTEVYGGSLDLDRANMGGLRATLQLPALPPNDSAH
ncbi:sensor histidine kinase [Polycladidibacter hongkongensis]|uniref:sensor histidine kinase n=1 Tax=Polycladidibacter hongkongensis TaxID=1647556 RepID=UPI0008377F43|nr:sensor histidine kinase [Pseudovibrio hongkongensis]